MMIQRARTLTMLASGAVILLLLAVLSFLIDDWAGRRRVSGCRSTFRLALPEALADRVLGATEVVDEPAKAPGPKSSPAPTRQRT
jgi:hypothetical protein